VSPEQAILTTTAIDLLGILHGSVATLIHVRPEEREAGTRAEEA